MYKVLADFHHASLLNSLIMLFEGRLGGELYRPIGMSWFEEGYWDVYNHPATAAQFLTTDQGYRPLDGTPPVNLIEEVDNVAFDQPAVYYCRDIDSGQLNKAITLEAFKEMDIDIVIASLPQHVERFKELIRRYKPNAKLIYQIGNAWTVEAATAPNIMASAIISDVPADINFVQYHQEFDLKLFKPSYMASKFGHIYSFVNVFQNFPDFPAFLELEGIMPAFEFRSFGGQCRDGAVGPAPVLADKMRQSQFIYHVKAGGDGYGHVLHNAAAVGRPLITKMSYYRGTLGEALMIPDVTCINIDGLGVWEVAEKIEHFAQPENHVQMCMAAYDNFVKVVNFDKEFETIKDFLACLK